MAIQTINTDTNYSGIAGFTAGDDINITSFATLTINSTTETITNLTFSGEGGKVLVENTSTTNPIFVELGGNFNISENGELDVNGGLIELATGDGGTKIFTLPKDAGNNEYTNLGAVWVGTDTFRDGTEYKVTYGEIDQLTEIVNDASLKNFFKHDTLNNQIEFLEAPASGVKIWIPNVQIRGITALTCKGQINATNCALEFDTQSGNYTTNIQVFNTVGIVQTSTASSDYMNNRRQVGGYNFLNVGSKAESHWDFYGMAETIILKNCVFSSRDYVVMDTNGASKVEAEKVAFINRNPASTGNQNQNSFLLGGQNSTAYDITIASPCRFRIDSNRGIIKGVYQSIKFYTTQSHTQIYHVYCRGFDNLVDDYNQISVGSGGNALVMCETGTSGNTFTDFNADGTNITNGLLDRGVGTRANKWNISTNFTVDVNKDIETSNGEFKNFTNQNLINNSAGTLLPTDGEVERMLIRSNNLNFRCGLSVNSMTNASTGLLYTNTNKTEARIAGCFSRPNANTTDRTYADPDYKYAANNRLHIKNITGGGSFESRAYKGVTGVNGFVFSDSGDFTYTVQLRKIGGTYSSAYEITDTNGTGLSADNTALSNAYSALADGDTETVQYKINFSKNTGATYDDFVNYFGLDVTTNANYETEFLQRPATISCPNCVDDSTIQLFNESKIRETGILLTSTNTQIEIGGIHTENEFRGSTIIISDGSTTEERVIRSNTTDGSLSISTANPLPNSHKAVDLSYTIRGLELHNGILNPVSEGFTAGELTSGFNKNVDLLSSQVAVGDTIRIRVTCQAGTGAFLPLEEFGIMNAAGLSFPQKQELDTVYIANNIDGSQLNGSGFTLAADYDNIQLDLASATNTITAQQIYNYFVSISTTEDGINNFFGAITPVDRLNYRINTKIVPLSVQNTSNSDLIITGGRIYRDDNISIIDSDTATGAGSGSLSLDTGQLVQYIQPQIEAALGNSLSSIATTLSLIHI